MDELDTNTPEGTGEISLDDAVERLQASRSDTKGATESDDGPEEPVEDVPEEDVEETEAEEGEPDDEGNPDEDDADDEEEDDTASDDDEDGDPEERDKGRLRQEDYTRKTQALAEERKAFEAERAEVDQQRQTYAERLDMLEGLIKQSIGKEPDWDSLYKDDPVEYAAQRARWQQEQEKLQAIGAERERTRQEQSAQQKKAFEKHLAQEQERLLERIPEWSDPATRTKEQKEIAEYGQKVLGFTAQELAGASDSRAIAAIRGAMLYDRLMAKKPKAEKKAEGKPPVVKPGTKKTKAQVTRKKETALRQQVKRSGSVDDAVALMQLKRQQRG
ncbi:hypothetical protein [Thalassospira sp.]|uniref:hypothetical protein n=1 Tax=Thalassospira sp. TaxID=1912094 RepID=UPI000C4502E6|nr:hypothetical protein [Thalassospira sp.]MAL41394.1 hypothetical protein [Thalassospira sp.]|tara:strand:- start:449 stop:1441 length:993 start_codon:yes stop_codon:yes gene_type:complete